MRRAGNSPYTCDAHTLYCIKALLMKQKYYYFWSWLWYENIYIAPLTIFIQKQRPLEFGLKLPYPISKPDLHQSCNILWIRCNRFAPRYYTFLPPAVTGARCSLSEHDFLGGASAPPCSYCLHTFCLSQKIQYSSVYSPRQIHVYWGKKVTASINHLPTRGDGGGS